MKLVIKNSSNKAKVRIIISREELSWYFEEELNFMVRNKQKRFSFFKKKLIFIMDSKALCLSWVV